MASHQVQIVCWGELLKNSQETVVLTGFSLFRVMMMS